MKIATWKDLSKAMDQVNMVIEVLDSRDPWTTRSEKLERMAGEKGKKLILVMNKSDLVPKNVLDEWKRLFDSMGLKSIYVSARERLGTLRLRRFIKREAPELPVKALIAGYPKVGKSSIINVLKGRSSASTSPIPGNPGYTRHFQLYRIDSKLYILDSPGIVPAEGNPLEIAVRGVPPEEMRNPIEVAVKLLERALQVDPSSVWRAYRIDERDPVKVLEALAVKRGWVRGREPDVDEAARQVIRDYHRAKLTFYVTPSDYGLEY